MNGADNVIYKFSYDAESRQVSRQDGSSLAWQFQYDGEGRRVQATAPDGTSTYYIYDAFGELSAEYADAAPTPPCGTCFVSFDHLGTTRMVTDQSGNIVSRHDFTPYGDELISGFAGRGTLWGAADQVAQKFTGAEQDNPDLSFFQARHYLATHGRFNSPDPVNFGADILNPQSWNGYAYVLNSPMSSVDPDGLADCNACVSGPGSAGAGSGGGGGVSVGFSFSFGGGGGKGLSPTPNGVRFPVGDTITAGRPLPIGGPMGLVGGMIEGIVSDILDWGPQTNVTQELRYYIEPTSVKQKAGRSAMVLFGAIDLLSPRSFKSFRTLKRGLGSAGEGNVWHHVVEQRKANSVLFGAEQIHNERNVEAVATGTNQAIANYYSAVRPFTAGKTVRIWLGSQSYKDQLDFGKRILEMARRGERLP